MNGLRKSKDDVWIAGVCAGIGNWLGIDAWIVRLIFVLVGGSLVWIYFLLAIFLPEEE